jgi:tRNA G18 (ribose-2'-O)-methylase SpoU
VICHVDALDAMRVERVHSIADDRVAVYRNLKDRELAREGERFIAEGPLVVRRLLESDYPVESLLLAEHRVEEFAALAPAGAAVYAGSRELLNGVIGFKFHSGVIACGRRKPAVELEQVVVPKDRRLTLVILPETANAENLGALMRISAAFGADAMVLGERSCDPFWRQAIRVSMGAVFRLPLVRSADLGSDLRRLREAFGVELAAAVVEEGAEPLSSAGRGKRLGLLFGNEAQGLSAEYVAGCDRRVTVPMSLGTDSLNVAVSAGIFLYHFMQVRAAAG